MTNPPTQRVSSIPAPESYALPGLFVADGSILPTSIGVNSQVPIMAMATRIAWGIADGWKAASLTSATARTAPSGYAATTRQP